MAGRVVRLQSSLTAAAARATATTESARRQWSSVDAAFAAHERDRRSAGSVLAGAVAYRLFVYLLPLFLVAVSVLGILTSLHAGAPAEIGDELGMSSYLIDSVDAAAEQSQRGLVVLIPLTLVAVLTGGIGAVRVLAAIHALAWGQPVRRLSRTWLAALSCFGFGLALLAVIAGTQIVRENSERIGIGLATLQVVVLITLWWVASRALPHDPAAGWLALLPGAVLVGIGLWGLHLASAYLLARRVAAASELYGSLGVAAALLVWLYLIGRLMVASAMLNATLWDRHGQPGAAVTPRVTR